MSEKSPEHTLPLTEAEPALKQRDPWYKKLAALLGVIFCFEVGVFLLIFPWVGSWDISYFAHLTPWAREVWINPFFRGAVSGLGALNLYISLLEVFRLRRFSA